MAGLDLLAGLGRGVTADLVGGGVDLATILANLGIAGGGYAAHKLGLIDQPPDLIKNEKVPFSSDWLVKGTSLADKGNQEYSRGRFVGNILPAVAGIAGSARSTPGTVGANRIFLDQGPDGWLQKKMAEVLAQKRNQYGAPSTFGPTTASFDGMVEMPLDKLRGIKGQRGEQAAVRADSLNWLKDYMRRTGKLPDVASDIPKEYSPFIQIGPDGVPWVNEGNHRIMAADALGWKSLPMQVQYHTGGELAAADWLKPQALLDAEKELLKMPLAVRRNR